jgi:hypothetical protein
MCSARQWSGVKSGKPNGNVHLRHTMGDGICAPQALRNPCVRLTTKAALLTMFEDR